MAMHIYRKTMIEDKPTTYNIDIEQWDEDEKPWAISKYNHEEMLINLMKYLKQTGGLEFAVLKDPALGEWWTSKIKQIEKVERKKAALDKLHSTMTAEELRILGIKL